MQTFIYSIFPVSTQSSEHKTVRFSHWIISIFGLIFIAISIEYSGLDQFIANIIYQLQDNSWILKENFIFEEILHVGAKKLLVLFSVILFIATVSSHWYAPLKHIQKPLWFLFISMATSTLLVSIGKSVTHVDCPWDLAQYGGNNPYLHLFDNHPGTWRYGRCFPAGHSSGGFSLVALYFFFLQTRPNWRISGLLTGLIIGAVFGITQQFRGAHFLSHDLWSLIVCLSVSLTYYKIFFRLSNHSQS